MPTQSKLNMAATDTPLTIYTAASSSEWVELSNKLLELLAREEELILKAREQGELINKSGLANFQENNILPRIAAVEAEGKPPRMVGASVKAANLLGKYAPDPVPAPAPYSFEPKVAREARETSEEVAAVREAIVLLRPQLTRAHLEASARLCDQVMPEYRAIAGRVCAALIALGLAEVEHNNFMYRHRNAARSMLRPIRGTGSLGDPRNPDSELRRLLNWAIQCGHLDRADIPADWLRRHNGAVGFWQPSET